MMSSSFLVVKTVKWETGKGAVGVPHYCKGELRDVTIAEETIVFSVTKIESVR